MTSKFNKTIASAVLIILTASVIIYVVQKRSVALNISFFDSALTFVDALVPDSFVKLLVLASLFFHILLAGSLFYYGRVSSVSSNPVNPTIQGDQVESRMGRPKKACAAARSGILACPLQPNAFEPDPKVIGKIAEEVEKRLREHGGRAEPTKTAKKKTESSNKDKDKDFTAFLAEEIKKDDQKKAGASNGKPSVEQKVKQ